VSDSDGVLLLLLLLLVALDAESEFRFEKYREGDPYLIHLFHSEPHCINTEIVLYCVHELHTMATWHRSIKLCTSRVNTAQ